MWGAMRDVNSIARASLVTLALALSGCGPKAAPGQGAPARAASSAEAGAAGRAGEAAATAGPSYAGEVAALDDSLARVRERAAGAPKDWLVRERVAGLHLERARLVGSYDDYAAAEAALAEAFAIAPAGAGPFMTRARLDFALHRNDRVDADLDAAEKAAVIDARERAAIVGLRADLDLQRGRYHAAGEGFVRAAELRRDPTAIARLAQHAWRGGGFDEADRLYAEALAAEVPPSTRAWLHLMRGLLDLDRGRLEDALRHYREGEAALPGWWLLDEHIAEAEHRLGRVDEARALYEDIVARTENPEFMDALASIARERGEREAAAAWSARARARHVALLERFPEAAAGHALEHFLESGDDPARALALAEANHRQRPNPESARLLAEAQAAAGDLAAARRTIEDALVTPWRSADLFRSAAAIRREGGDAAGAAEALAQARAIDPTTPAEL